MLTESPEPVAACLGSNTRLTGRFVGQAMRTMRGEAHPQLARSILKKDLPGETVDKAKR